MFVEKHQFYSQNKEWLYKHHISLNNQFTIDLGWHNLFFCTILL